jgi:hypothetical protein
MRFACIAVLVSACTGSSGPPITASMSFTVTNQAGNGMSTIDPLYMSTFDIEVQYPNMEWAHGDETDTADCKSTTFVSAKAIRTAKGPMAALIKSEILDKLEYWDVRMQLCGTGTSSILVHSEIAPLNLAFGCFGIPASAMRRTSDGWPILTSFTATQCTATILDVAVNKVLSNPDHEVVFKTDPGELP